jgi:hypothetical protein
METPKDKAQDTARVIDFAKSAEKIDSKAPGPMHPAAIALKKRQAKK